MLPLGFHNAPFFASGLVVFDRYSHLICTTTTPQIAEQVAYSLNQSFSPQIKVDNPIGISERITIIRGIGE